MIENHRDEIALPPICILAGGVGSRLGDRAGGRPKPIVEVAGRPFLLHQLDLLSRYGAAEVVLCVGYLGDQIEEAIGSERYGIAIRYSYDEPGLNGTLGAVRRAARYLGDQFLVLYGDTYLRLDYRAAVVFWQASGLPAFMSVLRNDNHWGPSNADFHDNRVVKYDKFRPLPGMRWIDYGLGGLTTEAMKFANDSESDLATLYSALAEHGLLYGFEVSERFYEIGTPSALEQTEKFLQGQIEGRSQDD